MNAVNQADQGRVNNLESLPQEMIQEIISHLDQPEIHNLSLVGDKVLREKIVRSFSQNQKCKISSQQELKDFIKVFSKPEAAQGAEFKYPFKLFKEITLVVSDSLKATGADLEFLSFVNPLTNIDRDDLRFLSKAAKNVFVRIYLFRPTSIENPGDFCQRIKDQISGFDNVKIKELNLEDCKITPQDAAKTIQVLSTDELERIQFCYEDFNENAEDLAKALSGIKTKEFNLAFCNLTPQDAATIVAGLSNNLESLSLYGNDFSEDAEDLKEALSGKKIKGLDLRHCQLTSQNAAKIIKPLSELEILCLDENDLSDDANAALLVEALNDKKIKRLNLTRCQLTSQNAAKIIKPLSELEILCLNENNLSDDANAALLVEALNDKKIKELNLSNCDLTSQNAVIIIKPLSELEILCLDENDLRDDANANAALLVEALNDKKIKRLNLIRCQLTYQNAAKIIKPLSELEILCLDENDLSEDGTAELLANALRGKKIKGLELSCCKILPQDAATIINVLPNKIEMLDFRDNDFTRDVVCVAEALKDKKIKKLDLSSCKLRVKHTAGIIEPLSELEILCLNKNDFSQGANAALLADALNGKKIRNLDLRGCELKTQSAATIIQYLPDELGHLDLSSNHFDENVKVLADALNGKKMRNLDLQDCQLDPQDAATIIQYLPDELGLLDLSFNDFDEDVEVLADALKDKKIKKLNLSNCDLTYQSADIIIKALSDEESLNLSSNDFTDNPKVLADVLSGKEIKSGKITNLNLESCKLTPQNAAIIIQGLSANNLESLNLESNEFRQNVEELANALRGKKIKELNLKWCSLTAQNAAKIIEKADAKTIIVSSNIFIFNQIDPIIQALKQTSCKIEECVLGSDDWDQRAEDAISERIRSNQQKTILDNIDIDAILELVSDMPL